MAERAFIADDDVRQRRAVRRALLPDFHFVEADDFRSAKRLLRRSLDYSLIILDIHLPGAVEGGLALFDEFHFRARHAVFIILSADTAPRFVNYGTGAGASFVAKPWSVGLLRALGGKARGVRAVDPVVAIDASELTSSWNLSPKERQLLACHLDGKTKRQTCRALGFNGRTHQSHVRHILAKAARAGESFERLADVVAAVLRRSRPTV